jgi:hypothetical protein
MTPATSSDNTPAHPGQSADRLILFLAVGFALLAGVLLGVVLDAKSLHSGAQTLVTSVLPVPPGTPDPVNLQLAERVESGATFLNLMLAVIGIIVTVISVAVVYGIWSTRQYASNLLRDKFQDFRKREIDPLFARTRAELIDLATRGTKITLSEVDIILDAQFLSHEGMLRQFLAASGASQETISARLATEEATFREQNEVTRFLIASLSRDPEIVLDACDKLYAWAAKPVVQTRADHIVARLRALLNAWEAGSPVRTKIQDAIYAINENRSRTAVS